MDALTQDIRYGLRRLRQSPGFTLIATFIIGLGIGGNTAIFSIVNAILIRPQPYADPGRLVNVYVSDEEGKAFATTSYPEYEEFARQTGVFSAVSAFDLNILNRATETGSEVVFAESASSGYWEMLGLRPALGRSWTVDEATPGGPPVALVGYATWQSTYGSDSSIVGRTVTLNGAPVTVIGVAPSDYDGVVVGVTSAFFLPYATLAIVAPDDWARTQRRQNRGTWVRARLRDGVDVPQARAAVDLVMQRLEVEYPEYNRGRRAQVVPFNDVRFHPAVDNVLRPAAGLLLTVVALVLAIACSNLANLFLASAARRQREVAIRLALGARRARIVRQLLIESVLIGIVGGAVGLVLAIALVRAIAEFQPPIPIPVSFNFGVDERVLAFTLVLSLATGILFGLAPALRASRPDLVRSLRNEVTALRAGHRRFGLRNVLVVSQVAVSLLLLVVAGLLVRNLVNSQQVDPGFEARRVAIVTVNPELGGLSEAEAREFLREATARVAGRPDVRTVALAERVPLGFAVHTVDIFVDGYPLPAGAGSIDVDYSIVGPGYFDALRVPLLAGRDFTERDDASAPLVVIVNEAMARRFWQTTDVVGRRFRMGDADGRLAEIVGVARDTKVRTLGEAPRSFFYGSLGQDFSRAIAIIVATTGSPEAALAATRAAVEDLNPNVPIFDARTMASHLGVMLFVPRMGAALLSLFGVLAMVLALVGLYGVIAFTVSQRTRELGIRIALGAQAGQVVGMVVREGLTLVATGGVVGLALALAVSGQLSGALVGVPRVDLPTFGAVSLLFALVATVASWIPGRRASRVEPVVALKHD